MKKIIPIIFVSLFLFVLSGCVYDLTKSEDVDTQKEELEQKDEELKDLEEKINDLTRKIEDMDSEDEQELKDDSDKEDDQDKDQNETPEKEADIRPIIDISKDELEIKALFQEKFPDSASNISVDIGKDDGTYAQGVVSFDSDAAGGWFLAAKTSGKWKIVQDGNGVILCELIAPYDFPADMAPECVDNSGKLIKR